MSGRILCFLCGLLFTGLPWPSVLNAQTARFNDKVARKRPPHLRNLNNVPRSKARIICPVFEDSGYPYMGIGLKFGDPFALTYKYYPNKHLSLVVDAGKSASGLYSKYYRGKFTEYVPDTLAGQETFEYVAHQAKPDWMVEFKTMYQWEAKKLAPGLQLYAGFGIQYRNTTLTYSYVYEDGFNDSRLDNFKEVRVSYGPVGVLGFEYSYFQLPLSAFLEISAFTDVVLDPGWQRFQGGLGIRYVF
jgi:hypothetical protein